MEALTAVTPAARFEELFDAGSQTAVDAEVVRAIRGNFQFVLLHAGNLGFYGAWETLVAAAARVYFKTWRRWVFIGIPSERINDG